jgi:hypothetical protein
MGFPRLDHNPVRYFGDNLKCSVCSQKLTYETTNQMWITAYIGTDTIPMLANLCSSECKHKLPKPPENYIQFPHKGGANLVQPLDEESQPLEVQLALIRKREKIITEKQKRIINENQKTKFSIIQLVRKILKK